MKNAGEAEILDYQRGHNSQDILDAFNTVLNHGGTNPESNGRLVRLVSLDKHKFDGYCDQAMTDVNDKLNYVIQQLEKIADSCNADTLSVCGQTMQPDVEEVIEKIKKSRDNMSNYFDSELRSQGHDLEKIGREVYYNTIVCIQKNSGDN